MAQDLIIAGNTYTDVTSIIIPTASGTAEFHDMSGDIAWMGLEAEHVGQLYNASYTLSETSFATWTPSTSATAIIASTSLSTFSADMSQYEYWLEWCFDYEGALNDGATKKVQVDRQFGSLWQNLHRRPYGLNNFETLTDSYNYCTSAFTGSSYTIYWNSSGTHTWTSGISYGFYGALTGATFSSTSATTVNVTPKTPVINARCSNTYMSTARAKEINQANSTIVVTGDLYRVKRDTSPVRHFYRSALEMYSDPLEVNTNG